MQLADLIADLNLTLVRGRADVTLADVCDDSRRATPGCLFIARCGTGEQGRKFITEAVGRGAAAVICEKPVEQPVAVACASPVDQRLAGLVAERFFDHPAKKLHLIGITGTNGKTTTAFIIRHLLNTAACKCGMIGTVLIDDGHTEHTAELTTPGSIDVSRTLAAMVNNGCKAAVLETSSHALQQGRVAALDFDGAVFTNLTGDHLDYHKDMADYLAAKAILFDNLRPDATAVINIDDPAGLTLAARCGSKVLRCTMTDNADADCRASPLDLQADCCRARYVGPWGDIETTLPMGGLHNITNALQALAAANVVADINPAALADATPVPGRLEPVRIEGASHPSVLVDYAHTHDALDNVLRALRPVTRGQLHCLFGCGGDRDRTKRPKMAAVACALADTVFITSDNPRTENPAAIIDEILTGIPDNARNKVTVDPDRAAAINAIITAAAPDDVILIAGKGHEDYQMIGNEKHHFDDREQARSALSRFVENADKHR